MKVVCIAGARPNFMKIDPLLRVFRQFPRIQSLLIHAGQHYDDAMSAAFFQDLELHPPDLNLQVGSGSLTWQTAEVMLRLVPVLLDQRPDLVVVVGDVNSTLAAALTAARLDIPVAHVEAGLRSFDRSMPEEINRQLTDSLSSFLFATEQSGVDNLQREGIPGERVFLVGNVMIDTLLRCQPLIDRSEICRQLGLAEDNRQARVRDYAVLTLHRPNTVDDPTILRPLLGGLRRLAQRLPIIFPVHPRTRQRIDEFSLGNNFWDNDHRPLESGFYALPPLSYLDFLCLLSHARFVLTDSGGIQEETTALAIPCLTLRENTERPVTVSEGTNQLVGRGPDRIQAVATQILEGPGLRGRVSPLWDRKAAERIADVLIRYLSGTPVAEQLR